MNIKKLIPFLIFSTTLLFLAQITFAQIVELPLSHQAYDFLDRVETKGLIEKVRNGNKPFSRLRVAELLARIEGAELTSVERSQLEWLREEFAFELKKVGEGSEAIRPRRHLFAKKEKQGVFFINPIFRLFCRTGGSSNGPSEESAVLITGGGELYGYLGNLVGFYISHIQTQDSSNNPERSEKNTPKKGIPLVNEESFIGAVYSETRANLSFQLPWFTLEAGLGSNVWGFGYRGNLALSDHPPNYGQIKITTHFGDWLDFTYIHASLNSGLVDSSRSYQSGAGFREVLRQKYFAGHRLEISPYPGIDLGLNETIIYGDRGPEILYLVPTVSFWDAGHYLLGTNDNPQMSADLELSLIDKVKFYGALYIDNIRPETMFDPKRHRNHIGFQGGIHLVDPLSSVFTFLENVDLRLEYTRLNPWVYSHKFPINTYESHGYSLGYWMGQNGDDLLLQTSYRPKRSLLLTLSYERRRKGDAPTGVIEQYREPAEPFLYGEVERRDLLGLGVTYRPYRDLFLRIGYKLIESKNRLYFGIEYNHYQ